MSKRAAILLTTFITWILLTAAWTAAQEPDDAEAEIVVRILELRRQIDELMAKLPREVRDRVRRRLAEPPGENAAPATEPVAVEPVAVEPVAVEHVAVEPAGTEPPEGQPPAAQSPLPRRSTRLAPCNTLQPLDEDADGKVSAADRFWRYLYLWTDKNGDGQIQEREVESAYERGVRQIDVALETFVRTKGSLGEVRLEDRVVLDLRGDGFSDRSRRDDGVLMIDATALSRGDGPGLLGTEGDVLEGIQPFRAGLAVRTAGGQTTALNCPRGD